jgi:hypothetical protein
MCVADCKGADGAVDLLAALFIFCFSFGVAFTLISFLGGHALHGVGQHGDSGAHAPVAHGHAAAAHAGPAAHGAHAAAGHATGHGAHAAHADDGEGLLAGLHLSPTTASVFLAWFGGVGYATYELLGLAAALGLILAALAGLVGATLVTVFLVRLLIPGQTFLGDADVVGEGTLARVSRDIRPEGIGEIVYTVAGTRQSDGARSVDGRAIARGTEVVVTRLERGIAYVQPWSAYVRESGHEKEG